MRKNSLRLPFYLGCIIIVSGNNWPARSAVIMKNEYTAVIKQENDWWVGWIEEVPGVNCQEKTYEELKETLEVTLREALDFNRQDALAAVGSGFKEEKIAI
jgi:predicted RNase H-like HicB family nuclease